MTSPHAIFYALLALLLGAVITLLAAPRRTLAGWLAFLFTAAASALVLLAAGQALVRTPDAAEIFWALPQFDFALRVYVDGLSAVFLILIALVALPAVFYSIRYMEHYPDYGVARYYPYLLLFLAGMIGLVTTTDALFFFFIFWQLMTLTSFALVRFEHRKAENRRAAWKYLAMMQAACFLTMLGAWLLLPGLKVTAGGALSRYDFDTISHHLPQLLDGKSWLVTVAFGLFLVGFGIKAGMWPFGQMWLPDAHPAAPSPVSALLSGVMLKTGVYGLIRYFLWLMPASTFKVGKPYPLHLWGWAIALLGTVTLAVGTAQALNQKQTKRLLAYSSIGQVGYILLGLGICLALINSPLVTVAALALYAALFHTLNHALFKGLLFLNAGSMLYATGTQDMGRMGGLMKHMPLTAICTLVGVLAIAGAPLTSGFASKWGLYGAAIRGAGEASLLPLCALVAIMTSGLTLAVFVRFFGASFLSRASTLVKEKAGHPGGLRVGWMLLAPKIWLAALCVILGLVPAIGITLIQAALHHSQQGLGVILADATPLVTGGTAGIFGFDLQSALAPLSIAGALAMMLLLARSLGRVGGAARRATTPWLCGYAKEADHNRYQSGHFFGELNRYLRWFGGKPKSVEEVRKERP